MAHKYQATVELPDIVKEFFGTMIDNAAVVDFDYIMGRITIEIEQDTDDQWELAETVREINDRLRSAGLYITVPRPVSVDEGA